jgi:hypothetical protein
MIEEHDAEQFEPGEQQETVGELAKADDLGLGEAERALLQWALRRQRAPGEPLLPSARTAPQQEAEPEPPPPPRPAPVSKAAAPAPARPTPPRPAPRPTPPRPVAAARPTPPATPASPTPTPLEAHPTPTPPVPRPAPPPAPEPARSPAPAPEPPPPRPLFAFEDDDASPWRLLHGTAEEAISALVAAGGPDPRDFASPRLTRRIKMLIALALVLLFVVSAVGGFVGYRISHRAVGSAPAAVGLAGALPAVEEGALQ